MTTTTRCYRCGHHPQAPVAWARACSCDDEAPSNYTLQNTIRGPIALYLTVVTLTLLSLKIGS